MRRKNAKKQKRILIISAFSLLLFLTIGYATFETNLSITAKGNIKDLSRVIQSWNRSSNEDFHTDYYRENIVSATFLDTAVVPDNAVDSWNVSEDKTHGGVMAWVIPNSEDMTKYDLYIGADGGVIANEDSSYLFVRFIGLETVDFNTFDTSNTTNMHSMFNTYNYQNDTLLEGSLTSIDFGQKFDTSKVTNMVAMFQGQINLNEIDLSDFDTRSATDMYHMFNYTGIIDLDLSSFDTSNVTNMGVMLAHMSKLTSLNFGDNFNTSNVTNMEGMFLGTSNITELNLCSFDTRKVTNMYGMFGYMDNLKNIYVGPNWITEQADTTAIFQDSNISSVTTGMCDTINSNNNL